jgi:hypothetical protein
VAERKLGGKPVSVRTVVKNKTKNKPVKIDPSFADEFLRAALPALLKGALRKKLIEPKHHQDRRSILTIVGENCCSDAGFELHVEVHREFIESAKKAIKSRHPAAAVLMIATAIEGLINYYFRELLCFKKIPHSEITEAIRGINLKKKLLWMRSLSPCFNLPKDVEDEIDGLIALRNDIAHYKAIPFTLGAQEKLGSYDLLEKKLKNFSMDLDLPVIIENSFEKALTRVDRDHRLAKKLFFVIYPESML